MLEFFALILRKRPCGSVKLSLKAEGRDICGYFHVEGHLGPISFLNVLQLQLILMEKDSV